MNSYSSKTAAIREKRLNAIASYFGDTDSILQEFRNGSVPQRIRTFSQDIQNDVQYALTLINTIKDAAIVVHGPIGCSVARQYFDQVYNDSIKWAVTNLNERDSIMGSDAKLRQAIQELYQAYQPKIIFVITTPVVAINNDDVESIVEELQNGLQTLIIPIYTDGFRSKVGETGIDAALHALNKAFFKNGKASSTKGNYINLLSVSENLEDTKELIRLLNTIGIPVNILPRFSSIENFNRAGEAVFTLAIHAEESSYLGKALAENFNTPFIHSSIPLGIAATSHWLTEISSRLGLESEANHLIQEETYHLQNFLKDKSFKGNKVFLNLPFSKAFLIASFLEELGFEIAAIKVNSIDSQHLKYLEELELQKKKYTLLVGDGQAYEDVNIIQQLGVNLYITTNRDHLPILRSGISVVDLENIPHLGFKGVYHIIDQLEKKLLNPSFANYLSSNQEEVYFKSWFQKKPNWYIKQEVK